MNIPTVRYNSAAAVAAGRIYVFGGVFRTNGERYVYSIAEAYDPPFYDTDLDGLADDDELREHGSDPLKLDTDGDGLTDGAEVASKTNPNNPDTDGDGISDSMDPDPLNPPGETTEPATTETVVETMTEETTVIETSVEETTVVETTTTAEPTSAIKKYCLAGSCLSLQEWSYIAAIIGGLAAAIGWLIRIKRGH